jgi:hypothetical protein
LQPGGGGHEHGGDEEPLERDGAAEELFEAGRGDDGFGAVAFLANGGLFAPIFGDDLGEQSEADAVFEERNEPLCGVVLHERASCA